MDTMPKVSTIKVPVDLLAALVGPAHNEALTWYAKADDMRRINHADVAANCDRYANEKAGIANQARQLIGIPPFNYQTRT